MIAPVRANGLVCRIGDAIVIDGTDVSVFEKECVGLAGPNGSGRTTLLQTLATLRAPDAGTLQIAGIDARRFPFAARAHVMYVGTRLPAAAGVRVREYLELVRNARRVPADGRAGLTVDAAIERSGLRPEADVERLSPGVRKQLMLAAALMVAPPLLLLDDPLASLDDDARRRFRAWLADARSGGTAMVAAVNTSADAEALCTRMLRLEHGRIVSAVAAQGVEIGRAAAAALSPEGA